MEKNPGFRIVGNISKEKKVDYNNELKNELYENHLGHLREDIRMELEEKEVKKTPIQEALIDLANAKTNGLMEEAGVSPYEIPQRNLHIIPNELYKKICGDDGTAMTLYPLQAIFFDAEFQKNPFDFGATTFHELLHLKGHFSAEINENSSGGKNFTPYREGVGIRSLQKTTREDGYYEHFRGLHEAIVSSCEREYIKTLVDSPILKEQKEKLVSEMPYSYFLKVFDYILAEISQEMNNTYPTPEKVRAEFLKSHFTGHLVTIGKIVEKTFGTGSFRILGMMNDSKSASQVLKSLQGFRGHQRKIRY